MSEVLTGHELAKVANVKLRSLGRKELPPQMIYHYMRDGKIPTVVVHINGKPKNRIELEPAKAWLNAFIEGKRSGNGRSVESLMSLFEDEEDVTE